MKPVTCAPALELVCLCCQQLQVGHPVVARAGAENLPVCVKS